MDEMRRQLPDDQEAQLRQLVSELRALSARWQEASDAEMQRHPSHEGHAYAAAARYDCQDELNRVLETLASRP